VVEPLGALEVGAALLLAGGVDGDDVRVAEAGEGLDLALEAGPGVGARLAPGVEELEGDEAVEAGVAGPVDDAHAAAGELAFDRVGADRPHGARVAAADAPGQAQPGAPGIPRWRIRAPVWATGLLFPTTTPASGLPEGPATPLTDGRRAR